MATVTVTSSTQTVNVSSSGTVSVVQSGPTGPAGTNVTSGDGAPSSTPAAVGYIYIDTTADRAYIAVGTASSADWYLIT